MTAICPVDGAPLDESSSSSRKMEHCKQCSGCWIDGNTLRGMLSGDRPDGAERVRLFDERVALCKPADRLCPQHRIAMSRFVYRAVDLDICPDCKGVWFDSGELRLLLASRPGGKAAMAAGVAGVAVGGAALASGAPAEEEGGSGSSIAADVVDATFSVVGAIIFSIFD